MLKRMSDFSRIVDEFKTKVLDPERDKILWFNDQTKELSSNEPPITNKEILDWIGRFVDREVFEIRNLNSRRTEDEAQRLRKRFEYLKEKLKDENA